jgi:hypothetical protein
VKEPKKESSGMKRESFKSDAGPSLEAQYKSSDNLKKIYIPHTQLKQLREAAQ